MKTNTGLVKHAEMALKEGFGYVWGTFGQVLSPTVFNQKKRQYPSGVGNYESFIKSNWLNKRSVDCIGLMKSYLWWNNGNVRYTPSQDINADMAYNMAKKKGGISSIPEIPGLCVWRRGHIGVYIGNGWVIEAQGTKYGVRKNRLRDRNFTHWMEHPHITYDKGVDTVNETILKLQKDLVALGFSVGSIDGIMGDNTKKAIRDFQKSVGLVIDGIAGTNTLNAIKRRIDKPAIHYAQGSYDSLIKKDMKIHETRFDDGITRGEVFVLLDQLK